MADFLGRLAARALGQAPVVAPRVPARFEPTVEAEPDLPETTVDELAPTGQPDVTDPARGAAPSTVEPSVPAGPARPADPARQPDAVDVRQPVVRVAETPVPPNVVHSGPADAAPPDPAARRTAEATTSVVRA
jgi:hypothetical protein